MMSAWVTVPCLLALRNEFNEINPNRDRGADGTIGDSSHTSASDHTPDEDSDVLRDHDADHKNEVHALDIDSTGPWNGEAFAALVARVIAGEKAKWLSATDRCRLKYVIFNRKIYSQTTDFAPRNYTGSDPHTNHAHFSARYETSCENDTRSFGVEKIVVAPPPPAGEVDDMAIADLDEYFMSAAKAIRKDPGYGPADRQRRDTLATVVRFALGLEYEEQINENLPSGDGGQLDRIEAAVTAEEPPPGS